jgi:hypothetical protein
MATLNLNGLIYTAADYKVAISNNGVTVPIQTLESFDYSSKSESEYIHVVGDKEPRGLKTNASTYPGKLTLQAGELGLILKAMGYIVATQITDATISIVSFDGNISFIFKSCVFTAHDGSVKAKDKHSLITINFESIGAVGI